jgi:hypothetical protein
VLWLQTYELFVSISFGHQSFLLFTLLSSLSLFLKHALQFSFRTGLLEIKSFDVYLISECLHFPSFFEGSFCDWQFSVDRCFLQVLVGAISLSAGLYFYYWSVCNHSVISFHWHGLSFCPFKILSSSTVFGNSVSMCLDMNVLVCVCTCVCNALYLLCSWLHICHWFWKFCRD